MTLVYREGVSKVCYAPRWNRGILRVMDGENSAIAIPVFGTTRYRRV